MGSCRECGKDSDGISVWGSLCSDQCRKVFHDRRKRRHEELRIEPLVQAPDELTVPDFEDFALKIAVYAILNLGAVWDAPQFLQEPEILARRVKELLLQRLPEDYVHTWREGSGWTSKDLYTFAKPVPRELLFDAMREAGFVWDVPWLA